MFSFCVLHKHPDELVYVCGQHSGENLLAPKKSISPIFEVLVFEYGE